MKQSEETGVWWYAHWVLVEGQSHWFVVWVNPTIMPDAQAFFRKQLGDRLIAVEKVEDVPPLHTREALAGPRNFIRLPKRKATQRKKMPPLEPVIAVQ